MITSSRIRNSLTALACAAVACACAAPSTVIKTVDDPDYRNARFKNFLVIGVSQNYDSRAQFERQMVSAIRNSGGKAKAYYTIVGNNPPVNREQITRAVQEGNFDAVLLTRVAKQEDSVDVISGAADTKTTRRSGSAIDLFRYDYEELNNPDTIQINTSIVVVTELYDAAEQKIVWAIETTESSSDGAGMLIDKEVETVIRLLRKDKLIGN